MKFKTLLSMFCMSCALCAVPSESFANNNDIIGNAINEVIDNNTKSIEVQKEEELQASFKETKFKKKYVIADVLNVRLEPNMKEMVLPYNASNIHETRTNVFMQLKFNSKVECAKYDDDWSVIRIANKSNNNYTYAYVKTEYLSSKKKNYKVKKVPTNRGFKSYMPYSVHGKSIFSRKSNQFKVQIMASTGRYGIRQVNGRFCVALGSYFTVDIGQYFDLVLANGTVIPCVLADAKANCDTDANNIFTSGNGCMSEFIVDFRCLNSNAKRDGNISSCCKAWDSPVVSVKLYDENCLR